MKNNDEKIDIIPYFERKFSFASIAGYNDVKIELFEIIDFLKNPFKYKKMGADIPKGILLIGEPGNGKTLFAKAIAGEANIPFYAFTGSEFVDIYVGKGASKIRQIFDAARNQEKAILFIDEIDTVGRKRGLSSGEGNDEREQTLNQLLSEIDGFKSKNDNILIIGATNRPDFLDAALIRSGRLEKKIFIGKPNFEARLQIFKHYALGKEIVKGINFEPFAMKTDGLNGADIKNILNDAALIAIRQGKSKIGINHIKEGIERITLGINQSNANLSEEEQSIFSVHEIGHQIVYEELIKKDLLQENISLSLKGQGVSCAFSYSKQTLNEKLVKLRKDLENELISFLGGRAAEELFFNDWSNLSKNDLKIATSLARKIVAEYGMSELGPVQFEFVSDMNFLGNENNRKGTYSDNMNYAIEQEMIKLLHESYNEAKKIIQKQRDKFNKLLSSIGIKLNLPENGHKSIKEIEGKKPVVSYVSQS